jgi:hypothetical protein
MTITIDPQISGVYDDGSPDGALRARLVSGELVRLPFNQNQRTYQVNVNGTAAATLTAGVQPLNPDGSATTLNLQNQGIGFANGMEVWQPFYGRVFGIRFRRDQNTPPVFCVMIDGQAYQVAGRDAQMMAEGFSGNTDEALVMVATDLPDLLPDQPAHKAVIELVGDPANNYTLVLYGYLVERRAGYVEHPRLPVPFQGVVLQSGGSGGVQTNACLLINLAPTMNVYALRAIKLFNSSGAAVDVFLAQGGAANQQTTPGALVDHVQIPAGASALFDFLATVQLPTTGSQRFWLWASAANAVYAVAIGGI